jgi:hypothetical protein
MDGRVKCSLTAMRELDGARDERSSAYQGYGPTMNEGASGKSPWQMSRVAVEQRIERAKVKFLQRDSQLFAAEASERSMTHKFATYLNAEFPGFSVDCEYNRDGDVRKILSVPGPGAISARPVYPDIIVHERRSRKNLLVIEAKKSGQATDWDRSKLLAFKDDPRFVYAHAVLLTFDLDNHDITFEFIDH